MRASGSAKMARNYEKRFSGLNRFLEAKEKEAGKTENKRPPLHELGTAEEVKKWIPSINREIEYCLQQLAGVESRNYTDTKVKEFQERIERLEKEHRRFVQRVRVLDPSYQEVVPWQPRGYSRKRSHEGHASNQQTKKLCSPLLEQTQKSAKEGSVNTSETALHCRQPDARSQVYTTITQVSFHSDDPPHYYARPCQHAKVIRDNKAGNIEALQHSDDSPTSSQNVLGLDYSSSGEED